MKLKHIRDFSTALLEKNGVPAGEAALIVDALLEADAKGLGSHGVMRLPVYLRRVKAGLISPGVRMRIVKSGGAACVLDARHGFGQVAATEGMRHAIALAFQCGIGACLVVNSGHFGMAARYGLMAAKKNMAGIVLSNTTPLMPPPGGTEKKIGNNPLAIVAPAKGDPVVLDMALSAVALGKIILAQNQGRKIPPDWATDKTGTPTDDPHKALDGGLLLPMAGPKGYGLAVAAEILTGVLAGTYAWQIPSLYDVAVKQSITHLFIAVDIAHFCDYDAYLANMEELKAGLKGCGKLPGVSEIFLPGEMERNRERATLAAGEIELPPNVVAELSALAQEAGIDPLE
jgi:LDH2 family malate/lactate/ureidoglycolate dehydrogenase